MDSTRGASRGAHTGRRTASRRIVVVSRVLCCYLSQTWVASWETFSPREAKRSPCEPPCPSKRVTDALLAVVSRAVCDSLPLPPPIRRISSLVARTRLPRRGRDLHRKPLGGLHCLRLQRWRRTSSANGWRIVERTFTATATATFIASASLGRPGRSPRRQRLWRHKWLRLWQRHRELRPLPRRRAVPTERGRITKPFRRIAQRTP